MGEGAVCQKQLLAVGFFTDQQTHLFLSAGVLRGDRCALSLRVPRSPAVSVEGAWAPAAATLLLLSCRSPRATELLRRETGVGVVHCLCAAAVRSFRKERRNGPRPLIPRLQPLWQWPMETNGKLRAWARVPQFARCPAGGLFPFAFLLRTRARNNACERKGLDEIFPSKQDQLGTLLLVGLCMKVVFRGCMHRTSRAPAGAPADCWRLLRMPQKNIKNCA